MKVTELLDYLVELKKEGNNLQQMDVLFSSAQELYEIVDIDHNSLQLVLVVGGLA